MADKRMFSKNVVCSDMFYKLSATSRDLYYQLNMEADDEGFVSNVGSIMKKIDSKSTDIGQLVKKNLIIRFKSGVLVIVHWHINNSIRSDRKKETIYKDEKSKLSLCSNGFYVLKEEKKETKVTTKVVDNTTTKCQPNDRHDDNLDKNRLDENSIVKSSIVENSVVESSIVNTNAHTHENDETTNHELIDMIFNKIKNKTKVPLDDNFFVTELKNKICTDLENTKLSDEEILNIYVTEINKLNPEENRFNYLYFNLLPTIKKKMEGYKQ